MGDDFKKMLSCSALLSHPGALRIFLVSSVNCVSAFDVRHWHFVYTMKVSSVARETGTRDRTLWVERKMGSKRL